MDAHRPRDGMRAASRTWPARTATGWRAALSHWLDAPVNWLGLHKVIDVLPASLALFAISIAGNSLFIYTTDRMREKRSVLDERQAISSGP